MRLVKLGIGGDHLRLEPDAELHAESVHLVDQRLESALQLLLIYEPVAQRAVVRIPVPEPAVVHDQHLYAQLRGFLGDLYQIFGGEVEVCSLPVVDEDRAALVLVFAADKVVSVEVVEGAAHLTKTAVGIDHDGFGGGELLARLQRPLEVGGVYAHEHAGLFVLSYLSLGDKVARVNQIEAVHLAHILVGVMAADGYEGVVLVAGFTAHGVDELLAVVQAAAFGGAFAGPGAVQSYHIELLVVQLHNGGVHAGELNVI